MLLTEETSVVLKHSGWYMILRKESQFVRKNNTPWIFFILKIASKSNFLSTLRRRCVQCDDSHHCCIKWSDHWADQELRGEPGRILLQMKAVLEGPPWTHFPIIFLLRFPQQKDRSFLPHPPPMQKPHIFSSPLYPATKYTSACIPFTSQIPRASIPPGSVPNSVPFIPRNAAMSPCTTVGKNKTEGRSTDQPITES